MYVTGDMPEFDNHVVELPDEPSFAPVRPQRNLSSASSGGDEFFGDRVVCPTCRGAGHISHGLALLSRYFCMYIM